MQFIIKVTSACNLSCTYCSEGHRVEEFLSIHTFKVFIDRIHLLMDHIQQKDIQIIWHGGEPLLIGKNWIKEATQYASDRLKEYNLSYAVQTNGTLIDDEWIDIFKEYSISVGISLDGYDDLHNQFRMTKDGSDSYDLIVDNIEILKENQISTSLLMVLNTEHEIDKEKIWNTIESLGLSLKIQPVVPIGNAEKQVEHTEGIYKNYINLLIFIYEHLLASDINVSIQPITQIVSSILTGESIKECSYSGTCSYNIMALYPNGDVGFCGRINNDNKNLIYGNIFEIDIVSLYNSDVSKYVRLRQQTLKEGECKGCCIWDYCHGGCSADATAVTGDLYTKYHYCKGYQALINYFMTDGLLVLKEALIARKRRYRMLIEEKDKLLKGLNDERE